MATKTIETKILLLAVAIVVPVELAAGFFPSKASYSATMLILGVVRVVEAALLVLMVLIWGKGLACIGLAQDQIVGGLKRGTIWSVGFGMCVVLGFAILYVAGTNPLGLVRTQLPSGRQEVLLYFAVGGFVAPVAEELLFRGIIYGFLRRWGVFLALAGSTAIFVLAHAVTSRIPVTQAVGGILFAIAYEVEGKLMAPITIHVLGNLAIFALSLLL